jgi:hypothetical protein
MLSFFNPWVYFKMFSTDVLLLLQATPLEKTQDDTMPSLFPTGISLLTNDGSAEQSNIISIAINHPRFPKTAWLPYPGYFQFLEAIAPLILTSNRFLWSESYKAAMYLSFLRPKSGTSPLCVSTTRHGFQSLERILLRLSPLAKE